MGLLRTLNNRTLEVPWMWSLTFGGESIDPNLVGLGVGVKGDVGALHWATNAGASLVSVEGTNDEPVMYRLAGWHDSYMPAGAEVPIETVYAAVGEFLISRRLPGCVRWPPVPTPSADAGALSWPDVDAP